MKLKYLALVALALCAFTAAAAQAATKQKARSNHTVRIADSDRDGASNRCERQADTSLRRKDSDRDGRVDGREDTDRDGTNNAAESVLRTNCDADTNNFEVDDAEIVKYDEANGLMLRVERRGLITAPLAEDLICEQEIEASASAAERDDDSDDINDSDDDSDDNDTEDVDDDAAEDADDDTTVACTSADLTAGREVDEAVVKGGKFVRIELDDED